MTGLNWSTLFALTLRKKHLLDTYRDLPIHYLQPGWSGEEPPNTNTAPPSGYALSVGLDDTDIKSYKLTIPPLRKSLLPLGHEKTVCHHPKSCTDAIVQSCRRLHSVLPLSNGNILVCIKECLVKVDGKSGNGNWYSMESINSENKVKEHFVHDPEGWA